jgi:hypothetical protein
MPRTPDGKEETPTPAPEEAPAPNVLGTTEPEGTEHESAGCSTGARKHDGSCCAKLLAWLTYQPLHQPNKCCKPQPYPCCTPQNNWYFPCTGNVRGGFPASAAGCGCAKRN